MRKIIHKTHIQDIRVQRYDSENIVSNVSKRKVKDAIEEAQFSDYRLFRRDFENVLNYKNSYGFVIGQEYLIECGSLFGVIEIAGISKNGVYFYVNSAKHGNTGNGSFEFNSEFHKCITLINTNTIENRISFQNRRIISENATLDYIKYDDDVIVFNGGWTNPKARNTGEFSEIVKRLIEINNFTEFQVTVTKKFLIPFFEKLGFVQTSEPIRKWGTPTNTHNLIRNKYYGRS